MRRTDRQRDAAFAWDTSRPWSSWIKGKNQLIRTIPNAERKINPGLGSAGIPSSKAPLGRPENPGLAPQTTNISRRPCIFFREQV